MTADDIPIDAAPIALPMVAESVEVFLSPEEDRRFPRRTIFSPLKTLFRWENWHIICSDFLYMSSEEVAD